MKWAQTFFVKPTNKCNLIYHLLSILYYLKKHCCFGFFLHLYIRILTNYSSFVWIVESQKTEEVECFVKCKRRSSKCNALNKYSDIQNIKLHFTAENH